MTNFDLQKMLKVHPKIKESCINFESMNKAKTHMTCDMIKSLQTMWFGYKASNENFVRKHCKIYNNDDRIQLV